MPGSLFFARHRYAALVMAYTRRYEKCVRDVGYYYTEPDGFELVLISRQARYYPWHMHMRHWTVGMVRHGEAVLATRNATCRLGAGQSFCLRPYAPHSLRVEPQSSLLVACLDARSMLLRGGDVYSAWSCRASLQPQEAVVFEKALAACQACMAEAGCTSPWGGHYTPLLQAIGEIAQRVLDAPDELLRIDQMAAYAGYSPWYFLRAFQHVTGMTPHAFQLLCRLRLSCSLLRADTAASTVAVSAGFADQSHMHKVFKRHLGLTPGEFKDSSIKLTR